MHISALPFKRKIQNVWENLSEKKRTKIVASVCCPCIFIRYWPDFLAFIFWLIFYFESNRVCSSSDTKSAICETNQTARDVTGGLTIFFFLVRVLKYCRHKYQIRPQQRPQEFQQYGYNL